MRVCLICTEFLGLGGAGGFGYVTRITGKYLAMHGVDVYAVIPQPRGISESKWSIDEIQIASYPRFDAAEGKRLFRECDADIYMSMEPSLGTLLAQLAAPEKKHVVSFQDPRVLKDWWIEFKHPTFSKKQVLMTCLYYDNPLTRRAVKKADLCVVPAKFLISKSKEKYGLKVSPSFLPTPIKLPSTVEKSKTPTVCYVGRWDRRKRMELFFELARKFPSVKFIAPGVAQDKEYDRFLRQEYGGLENLEMPGFLDQFRGNELSRVYERSWMLVNTAGREGLPNTFMEACGHKCAILSASDPDEFATKFGVYVADGDFESGLRYLLEENRWKEKGEQGYQYVIENYEADRSIQTHLDMFNSLLRD